MFFKCKMCGGELTIQDGVSVCECEYCGSKQTVPSPDNEKKITLFDRANRMRLHCEFDKAASVYESIAEEFPEEAEAYWGILLCKYGIEYIDDAITARKIPTCHRSSFESIFDNSDYKTAIEKSDSIAKEQYIKEAEEIEEIRNGIIEVSSKETPYDIFICYKETDRNNERTIDSVIAQDIYDELVEKGYKVFFSRITLEDKLGEEYEPYIFAAINSAKIMLVIGTCYENYNAIWVRNEWSRFLELISKGEKKTLIPCYRDIDAYDMPKEFIKLQSLDIGKVGAIQDLIRGIEKIIQPQRIIKYTEGVSNKNDFDNLLKRGFIFCEDQDWINASSYFDKVLDIDPENGDAYLGKLMADCKISRISEFEKCDKPFDSNANYRKVLAYCNKKTIKNLEGCLEIVNKRHSESQKRKSKRRGLVIVLIALIVVFNLVNRTILQPKNNYDKAIEAIENEDYDKAAELLESTKNYKDSNSIKAELNTIELKNATIGDAISFGVYEQDNNKENGTEPIEWIVLDKTDNQLLVISKEIIDQQPYNLAFVDVNWADSTVREWLNEDFINNAFSEDERSLIKSTIVKSEAYTVGQNYIPAQNDTEDQIFLLSLSDVENYFTELKDRRANPTDYVNSFSGSDAYKCRWMLRTMSYTAGRSASIVATGQYDFTYAVDFNGGVRPAMWISIN